MSNSFDRGMYLFSEKDFASAEECFLDALGEGSDRVACLLYHGVCKFIGSTYLMEGTGFIRGMSRRGNLIDAKKSLREAHDLDPSHADVVRHLALCSYVLGKLIESDGYTVEFYKYYEIVRDLDYELFQVMDKDIASIDAHFSIKHIIHVDK
jgi:tetratricopeptide (TPR) repeat protein